MAKTKLDFSIDDETREKLKRCDYFHELAEELDRLLYGAMARVTSTAYQDHVDIRLILGDWHTVIIPVDVDAARKIMERCKSGI